MPSQFGDADSWQARTRPDVPQGAGGPRGVPARISSSSATRRWRTSTGRSSIALYGEQRGKQVKYAEAFQINQYGRQPSRGGAAQDVPD